MSHLSLVSGFLSHHMQIFEEQVLMTSTTEDYCATHPLKLFLGLVLLFYTVTEQRYT
jgi:hypothetical protein